MLKENFNITFYIFKTYSIVVSTSGFDPENLGSIPSRFYETIN